MSDPSSPEPQQAGKVWITLVICAGVIVVSAAVYLWIVNSQPEAQRSTETRETAMLVETVKAERGTFRPQIAALGQVEAARDISPGAQVPGLVVERSPNFTPGGFLAEGEALLKIDPADYQNAL